MGEPDPLLKCSLQQFLADAAHDLRQPLNAIQMYLGILQRQSVDVNHEVSQIVGDSLRSMQANINLLTHWARVEQNCLKSLSTEVDGVMWSTRLQREGIIEQSSETLSLKQYDEFDLMLAVSTLRDMMRLFPADQSCQRTSSIWGLSIHTGKIIQIDRGGHPQFMDQLYQLGLVAGKTILEQLGFQLGFVREGDGYRVEIDRS